MAYPTYSSYRDSGVAWLGEVPSHWGVKRLKFMAKLRMVLTINISKAMTAIL